MKKEHVFFIVTLLVTFLLFHFLYRILSPFLEPIFWAIFLAMVFYPAFRKLEHLLKKKKVLSAMVMTFLVILVIGLPFIFLIVSLANEAVGAYHSVEELMKTGQLHAYLEKMENVPILNWVLTKLGQRMDLSRFDLPGLLLRNLRQISTVLLTQSSAILKGLSSFFVGLFFTLLALYYFFKDGAPFFAFLKGVLPIPAKERDLLIDRFKEMVSATIYGGMLIAVIQGLLGGLSFWVLGLPSPVLWGTGMALFSFIPLGGTALIWFPASVILLIQNAYAKGIILLAIGVFIISMVDNFLRPLLVGSRTKVHPLLLFFAVFGGIQVFGMIGVIAGPLIATLCLTLIEIYTQTGSPESSPSKDA
jgi:predicted PurR-regulated permease PerM